MRALHLPGQEGPSPPRCPAWPTLAPWIRGSLPRQVFRSDGQTSAPVPQNWPLRDAPRNLARLPRLHFPERPPATAPTLGSKGAYFARLGSITACVVSLCWMLGCRVRILDDTRPHISPAPVSAPADLSEWVYEAQPFPYRPPPLIEYVGSEVDDGGAPINEGASVPSLAPDGVSPNLAPADEDETPSVVSRTRPPDARTTATETNDTSAPKALATVGAPSFGRSPSAAPMAMQRGEPSAPTSSQPVPPTAATAVPSAATTSVGQGQTP